VTELAQDQEALIAALQAKLDAANAKIAQQAGGLVAGEKDGFAECLTDDCDAYKELVPIPVRVEVVEKLYPPGSAVHGIESTTKYVLAVNDQDMICPHCKGPRSVLEDRPRKIPKGF
jgi:hypothetical protein